MPHYHAALSAEVNQVAPAWGEMRRSGGSYLSPSLGRSASGCRSCKKQGAFDGVPSQLPRAQLRNGERDLNSVQPPGKRRQKREGPWVMGGPSCRSLPLCCHFCFPSNKAGSELFSSPSLVSTFLVHSKVPKNPPFSGAGVDILTIGLATCLTGALKVATSFPLGIFIPARRIHHSRWFSRRQVGSPSCPSVRQARQPSTPLRCGQCSFFLHRSSRFNHNRRVHEQ